MAFAYEQGVDFDARQHATDAKLAAESPTNEVDLQRAQISATLALAAEVRALRVAAYGEGLG